MTRRLAIVAAAALAVVAGPVTPAGSAGPAPTASLTLVAAGSDFVDAAWRTGDPTVFVVAQSGQILPLRGTVLGAAVLDISDEVTFGGEQGLLDEVRGLDAHGLRQGVTASRALGYAQFLQVVDGTATVEQAVMTTAQATRRFVRRQRSWFRRDHRMLDLDAARADLLDRALEAVAGASVG